MMTFVPPRLRKPAGAALAGLLFAAAWLVRGGPLWWVSINAVILTAVCVARLYWLGGKDNFAADRAAAEQVLQVMPEILDTVRGNRHFLVRAVRFLRDAGIRQFIDIGSGLPSSPNVHEVARAGHALCHRLEPKQGRVAHRVGQGVVYLHA